MKMKSKIYTNNVFVTSRSFSENIFLKNKLLKLYPKAQFNLTGSKIKSSDLINICKNYNKLIIGLDVINTNILKHLPNLKVISKYGVGLDKIKLQELKKFNIKLGFKIGINKRSVSELTLSMILNLSRQLIIHNNFMKNNTSKQIIGSELTNKTIGIIGAGSIGQDLINLLKPFNCKIIINDIRSINKYKNNPNIIQKSLKYLLSKSDIITVHTPLNSKTINLINSDNLKIIKNTCLIINCARGGIINESSLYRYLSINKKTMAFFDVFEKEPPFNNKLLSLNNFFSTPHIGGTSDEAIIKMGLAAIEGLDKHVNINKLLDLGYE